MLISSVTLTFCKQKNPLGIFLPRGSNTRINIITGKHTSVQLLASPQGAGMNSFIPVPWSYGVVTVTTLENADAPIKLPLLTL